MMRLDATSLYQYRSTVGGRVLIRSDYPEVPREIDSTSIDSASPVCSASGLSGHHDPRGYKSAAP